MIDYKEYPTNWNEIRLRILTRANNCCEGSPAYPSCRAENGKPHPITGSKVVLTIAHMNHDKGSDENTLKALCQRCHLKHDINHHIANRKYGRKHKQNNMRLNF